MNVLTLSELKELEQALNVKRMIERRTDHQLHGINRYKRRDVVKTRLVNGKKLQNIFYAYLSNQAKDIDKSKLVTHAVGADDCLGADGKCRGLFQTQQDKRL